MFATVPPALLIYVIIVTPIAVFVLLLALSLIIDDISSTADNRALRLRLSPPISAEAATAESAALTLEQLQAMLGATFGHKQMTLPEGLTHPDHWAEERPDDVGSAWRQRRAAANEG